MPPKRSYLSGVLSSLFAAAFLIGGCAGVQVRRNHHYKPSKQTLSPTVTAALQFCNASEAAPIFRLGQTIYEVRLQNCSGDRPEAISRTIYEDQPVPPWDNCTYVPEYGQPERTLPQRIETTAKTIQMHRNNHCTPPRDWSDDFRQGIRKTALIAMVGECKLLSAFMNAWESLQSGTARKGKIYTNPPITTDPFTRPKPLCDKQP